MPAKIDQSNLPIVYQMVTSPKAPEGPILSEEMGMVYTANRIYNLEKKIRDNHETLMRNMADDRQRLEAQRQEDRKWFKEEIQRAFEKDPRTIEVRARIERLEAEFARAKEICDKNEKERRLRKEQEFSISKFVKELFSKIRVMFESIKVFASIIKLDR